MDEQNHPNHPGEEAYYSPFHPQGQKLPDPSSRSRGQHLLRIFIGLTAILLVVVIVFGFIIVRLLTTSAQNSPVPVPVVTSTTGTTPSQIGTTPPTVALTPTQVPTPASCLPPCVAYQETGTDGWHGWALTSDWRIVDNNKLLSNDGSAGSNQAGPSAIPPYSLPQRTQNFAIEVGITIPQGLSNAHVSITACGSTTSGGWQGYEGLIDSGGNAKIFASHDALGQTNFNPGPKPHTYRLEVRGNVITLFVDQGLVAQATDNKFLSCGPQIGIVSSLAVIHVSSFKAILL